MASYAEGTKVSVDKSQHEVMQLLSKHGITKKAMMSDEGSSSVGFEMTGVAYRITIVSPNRGDRSILRDGRGSQRTPQQQESAYQAEDRRRWRSLVLVMKAKLVAIQDNITTFEQEFLAYIVTDNGQTVGERIIPQLQSGGPLALGSGR